MTESFRDVLRRKAAWAHDFADRIAVDCDQHPPCRICAAAIEGWRYAALTFATRAVRQDLVDPTTHIGDVGECDG